MQKYILILMVLLLAACNLTDPQSAASTPTGLLLDGTPDVLPSVPYVNTKHAYTFQPPQGIDVVEDGDNDRVWIDEQIEIYVTDVNPEEARGDGAPVISDVSAITIGQYPARRLSGYVGSVGGGTPQSIQQVIIPHNNQYYVFTVYELKRATWDGQSSRTPSVIPAVEVDLLNSILGTLQFTA